MRGCLEIGDRERRRSRKRRKSIVEEEEEEEEEERRRRRKRGGWRHGTGNGERSCELCGQESGWKRDIVLPV